LPVREIACNGDDIAVRGDGAWQTALGFSSGTFGWLKLPLLACPTFDEQLR
jgi:hypothetical protein